MKLIEEVKKTEQKAEKMKKDAEKQGQELLDTEHDKAKKAIIDLEQEQEIIIKKKRAEAAAQAEKRIAQLKQKYDKELEAVKKSFEKNKEKAVEAVQKIILQWPSSR